MIQDARHVYAAAAPQRNEWALSGDWTIGKEDAVLNQNGGSIVYRFHARDLHLVLGPARTASRCGFVSPFTVRRPATATAPMSMPTGKVW